MGPATHRDTVETASEPPSPEAASLRAHIDAHGQWFHNLRLPVAPGRYPAGSDAAPELVQTAPEHFLGDFPSNFWSFFSHAVPDDLTGKTVLDIGCNAGFYSFEMHRRGAARVLGIDHDARYLRQAEFARTQLGLGESEIEFRLLDTYDVGRIDEQFDLVIFMGVLYHLKHPLYALEEVTKRVRPDGGLLLFQTMERGAGGTLDVADDYPITERDIFMDDRFPRMYFIENKYAGDWTNWWIPNPAATMAMLRTAGLTVEQRPCHEVYLCRRGHAPA